MKATILAALVCALPTFGAQAASSDQPSVMIAAPSIELPSAHWSRQLSNFDSYQGSWELSNGQILYLLAQGPRMYAQVDDQPRRELLAAGMNTFVAADRSMKLSLGHRLDGDVTGEVLLRGASGVAGLETPWLRLAFNR